jgi:hypothetical protein
LAENASKTNHGQGSLAVTTKRLLDGTLSFSVDAEMRQPLLWQCQKRRAQRDGQQASSNTILDVKTHWENLDKTSLQST